MILLYIIISHSNLAWSYIGYNIVEWFWHIPLQLYSFTKRITLKMAGLLAETC